jgi:glycosyltransferase involved in cell wall biosynthesis
MARLLNNATHGNYKVSVITVSYNCSNTIAKTMASVLSQNYYNIEYIIVDSCSTDNTHQIIQGIMDDRVRLVIEDDEGIYDAMNKGFALATGDIIYYLNSGDCLFDETILEKICSIFWSETDIDVVYGDTVSYSYNGKVLIKMKRDTPFHVITRGIICHQAIFAKKSSFLSAVPFNINYKIYADYDWLLDGLCNNNYRLRYLNVPVVYFQAGGFSQQGIGKYSIERVRIINKFFLKAFNLHILFMYPKECGYFIIVYFYLVFYHIIYIISPGKGKNTKCE